MARNKVEKDADALLMCHIEEAVQVFVGTVAGRHLLVIADVVPGVLEGGVVAGIDPERIAAQALDVIQFLGDAVDVADPVTVRVIEGLGIDLIENSVL